MSCSLALATGAFARTTSLFHRLQPDGVGVLPLNLDYERAEIESRTNDNSAFVLTLEGIPVLPPERLVLRLGDTGYLMAGLSRDARGLTSFSVLVDNAAVVPILQQHLEAAVFLRKHPGHTFLAWFEPDKASFSAGEEVTATLHIRNTGKVAIRFRDGGRQRGPRNNQFRFTATLAGRELPVIGPVVDFGGLATHVDLRPGDEFTKRAEVTDWIAFTERGHVSVQGWFEFELLDGSERARCVWEECAIASFEVLIR